MFKGIRGSSLPSNAIVRALEPIGLSLREEGRVCEKKEGQVYEKSGLREEGSLREADLLLFKSSSLPCFEYLILYSDVFFNT